MFASTSTITYLYESTKRDKMLILTTYDFAHLFGGGIDSTIQGGIDRLCF